MLAYITRYSSLFTCFFKVRIYLETSSESNSLVVPKFRFEMFKTKCFVWHEFLLLHKYIEQTESKQEGKWRGRWIEGEGKRSG